MTVKKVRTVGSVGNFTKTGSKVVVQVALGTWGNDNDDENKSAYFVQKKKLHALHVRFSCCLLFVVVLAKTRT